MKPIKTIIPAIPGFFAFFPNPLNRLNCEIAINALDAFAIEGLDISAKGLQRVMFDETNFTVSEIVHQLKPRDYDASPLQIERVLERLKRGQL